MIELGINIDHVATVRQARRTYEPDPVTAAAFAELGGADVITVHLREDRRHIIDRDVRILRQTVTVKYNLEMSCAREIVDIACEVVPDQATLVPEKREEVTTEGGLNVVAEQARIGEAIHRLKEKGVFVALFLDPDEEQIRMAKRLGADAVELHTGTYALAKGPKQKMECRRLADGGRIVVEEQMRLHAGHGLNYQNVTPVAAIENMQELNIGHSIIARSIFVGLQQAVADMKRLLAPLGAVRQL